ncbi:ATP-binding cassette domain-containing protein [Leifsonia sp. LS-T14]|uniref:ATP-binding cassette domain-containing protein n=1 Tax=unclassified Leifsonia TaxID=2663824 RepID=UPI0035A570E0
MLLDVERLSFAYRSQAEILHDISFSVGTDELVGLIGPNGSGKSTLIKVIVDLLAHRRGSVRLSSQPNGGRVAKANTMYVASNDHMPEFLTGEEYLRFLHGLYGERIDRAEMNRLFERYQMAGRSADLIEDLSHGMRKKLQLIAALLLRRKLTIVDETLNGIDIDAVYAFEEDVEELARDGRSVILCSHDFPLLERVTDRILFLHRRALMADAPTAELTDDYGSLDALVRDLLEATQPCE